MSTESVKTELKVIFALTLVHFIGDFYASFINPLLPILAKTFTLSLAEVGLITGISRFLSLVVQPSVGYISDNYQARTFILGGPLLSIIFISLIGVAPSFLILLVFLSLGSIGCAMFHPSSAGMVSRYAGKHLGFSMSIFTLGGTLAFGVGPLFIAYLVDSYGLRASPFAMIFGMIIMIVLFRMVPSFKKDESTRLGFISSIKEALGAVWKPVLLIWVIMVLRAFVSQSFLTFIPLLFAREGYSLMSVGMLVSLFTVGGAIGGLLAGHLSDRMGYKPIFCCAHGSATFILLLLLFLPGNWAYFSSLAGGFFILATIPLGIAMAQDMAPKGRSMVSSLMMGLALGLGGMLTVLTGMLADFFSLHSVLAFVAVIPALTIGLIMALPGRK